MVADGFSPECGLQVCMMPAKLESIRRKRRTRKPQDLGRGSSGVKNRKTRNLRALRHICTF